MSHILFGCEQSLDFCERFHLKVPISIFTEVCPVESALTYRQTDGHDEGTELFSSVTEALSVQRVHHLAVQLHFLADSVTEGQIAIRKSVSKVIPLQARCGPEVQLYSSMTAVLEGLSGQQHATAALYPRERAGTHFRGGWVGHRAGLDGRKSRIHSDTIPDRPARSQ